MNGKARRNICLIGSYGPSLVKFRGALIHALQRAGMQVHALSADIDESTRNTLDAWGVTWEEVPLARNTVSPIRDLAYLHALRQCLGRLRPDVVMSYTAKPVIFGSIAARAAGVGRRVALISGRGSLLAEGSGAPRWQRLVLESLYRLALKGASAVIFQNKDDLEFFVRRNLIAADVPSHVVAGSGVDLQMFQSVPVPSRLTFLMIARLLHAKGVREYCEMARQVRRKNPDVSFLLGGWFESSAAGISVKQFESWNSDEQVKFIGRLDDVREALRQASVFVLPSYYGEGVPRTVLEAMACARPIITTDVAGCRETVSNAQNGFLVPARNVEALVVAADAFVKNASLIDSMGRRSRQMAEDRFDATVVAAHMVEILAGGN